MKVVVLTTSYPRHAGDVAGTFVRDAVEAVRASGVEVEVVSPATFPHFGLAYGAGVVGNLRARPAKALLLPAMLGAFARAARRASRDADLVHAHWLPSALAALATGKPYVVQLWGTDVELARRAPALARPLLARARIVICASNALADAARELGAREVRVIPSGVALPDDPGEPDEPAHVLYAGRLSPEKGVLELAVAAQGLPLVVVGDGPLRDRVPGALGFVPPQELGEYYRRASIVVCPSHREGYGVAAAEAAAWGRPVVASDIGGLRDLVAHEETGLLVPPGDVPALRAALERLLGDAELRRTLGAEGRRRAQERLTWAGAAQALGRAYAEALGQGSAARS
jgi:glycosyltransferase involved in cell wall biosynthesis